MFIKSHFIRFAVRCKRAEDVVYSFAFALSSAGGCFYETRYELDSSCSSELKITKTNEDGCISHSAETVRLEVSPEVVAECGQQVSLHCNTSSSHDGLSVKRMEWSQGSTSLCSVDSEGTIITHGRHSLSDFYCEYKDGQLSLVFQKMLPLESGHSKRYRCKLHSNQGVAHNYTTVELQGQSPHLLLFRQSLLVSMFVCFLYKCAKSKQI